MLLQLSGVWGLLVKKKLIKRVIEIKCWCSSIFHRIFGIRNSHIICQRPFSNLILGNGHISVCCYHSLKLPLALTKDKNKLIQNAQLKQLQAEVISGSYASCPKTCPVLARGKLVSKKYFRRVVVGYGGFVGKFKNMSSHLLSDNIDEITMAMEDECNFSCPSCRKKPLKNSLTVDQMAFGWDFFYANLAHFKVITLGGSGEPLLADQVREFLFTTTLDEVPHLEKVTIVTNGSLMTENFWQQIQPHFISRLELVVSVDGVDEATYEQNRRGGRFSLLRKNLDLASKRHLKDFYLSMVVQENNFLQMPLLQKMAQEYSARAHFIALRDWNTFEREEFLARQVTNSHHPRHHEYLKILRDASWQSDNCDLGELLGALT